MRSARLLRLTPVCLVVLYGACASSSPTEPQTSSQSLGASSLPVIASGLPVTADGLPILEFSVSFNGPAPGSVLQKGTPFSISNRFTLRGPASWIFVFGLVRDDGATFVPHGCGGGSSGGGTISSPGNGGSSESMDGSLYLFTQGHTVNGFALAKYSTSPSDYALWLQNGWIDNVYMGGALDCVLLGERVGPIYGVRKLHFDQATERQDIPLNWRVE